MKQVIKKSIVLMMLSYSGTLAAQAWTWAAKSSGTGTEQTYGITSDASGNNYIAGTYINGNCVLGTTTLTVTGGSSEGFLAKTNSGGSFQWAVRMGGTMSDYAQCVVANSTDVFVSGVYRSTATFYSSGTSTVTATLTGVTTDDECFIARYNSAGVVQWAIKYTGVTGTNQKPRRIAVNNTLGLIYVTGETGGKMFTNCYNISLGTLQWSTVSSNTGNAYGWGVVSDGAATGNCYAVAQYAAGPVDLGMTSYIGSNGALLVKYNSSGVVQWVKNIGGTGTGDEYPRGGLGIDASGNLYIAGDFSGPANISGITLSNPGSAGTRNLFVAKYDNAGTVQWAKTSAGTTGLGTELVYGMETDASGNSYLAVNNQENNSVVIDCQTFNAQIGNTDQKLFVVKYDNLGNVSWSGAPAANNSQTSAWCIATKGDGTAVIGGLTIGTTTFGGTVLTSANADAFLAKAGSSVPVVSGTTICSGSTAVLTASFPTGSGIVFNWYAAATGGSPLFTGASFTTPVLTATTTYYLSVVPGGCASTRVPVTVTVNPKPVITVTGPSSLCPAYSGTLTASGASTYLWMPGNATGSTLSISPLATTTYTVTGTNSFGCTGTATFTVNTSAATNAVTNPAFSAGPASVIGSTLPIETGNCTAGSYKVGPTFYNKCTAWPATIYDHTVGTSAGQFLMIDNASNTIVQTAWSQLVSVTGGKTYTFSFWSNCLYSDITHPVTIDMYVDGVIRGTATAMGPVQQWRQYSCTYTAPMTTVVMLKLDVRGTSAEFRDFGIDDIFFGYCANDNITVNNTSASIACTYSVTATVNAVNGSGGVTLLTSPTYAIAPGASQVYSFTPPSGYWIDYTSLNFITQTSTCPINNFQLVYDVNPGNCVDCSTAPSNNNVTIWENMGGNVFNIHADLGVGGRMADQIPETKTGGVVDLKTQAIENNNLGFNVFPNPSNGLFTLSFPGDNEKTVEVYDLLGNLVFEKKYTTDQTLLLDLTKQADNIYVIKVVCGGELIIKRIIKQ